MWMTTWTSGSSSYPPVRFERLTFDNVVETDPFWSPDGQFVTYVKNESGNYNVWRRRGDGTGVPELLLDDERSLHQVWWSPDGEWMVFRTGGAGFGAQTGASDIVGFRPGVDSATTPLVATTEFVEKNRPCPRMGAGWRTCPTKRVRAKST